jgi:hypothetical protein
MDCAYCEVPIRPGNALESDDGKLHFCTKRCFDLYEIDHLDDDTDDDDELDADDYTEVIDDDPLGLGL